MIERQLNGLPVEVPKPGEELPAADCTPVEESVEAASELADSSTAESKPAEETPAIERTITSEAKPPEQKDTSGKEVTIVLPAYDTYTRKQLYDEIWTISAAKVARKYNIPYALFMRQVKEAGIPIPPSGYWTKLEFGKPVEKTELTGDFDAIVSFEITSKDNHPSEQLTQETAQKHQNPPQTTDIKEYGDSKSSDEVAPASVAVTHADLGEPETVQQFGQTYNVYDRDTLYKEVWSAPVTEVSKKYKVSDVAIHKVCKALDVRYRHGDTGQSSVLANR